MPSANMSPRSVRRSTPDPDTGRSPVSRPGTSPMNRVITRKEARKRTSLTQTVTHRGPRRVHPIYSRLDVLLELRTV